MKINDIKPREFSYVNEPYASLSLSMPRYIAAPLRCCQILHHIFLGGSATEKV